MEKQYWYWVYKHTEDKKGIISDFNMLQAIFGNEKEAKKYIKEKEKEYKGVKWDFEVTFFIHKKENF